MAGVVRLGDRTSHGGRVVSASSSMDFEGIRAALVDDLVSCPIQGHGTNPIVEGDPTWLDGARAVVVHGCKAACGCIVFSSLPESGAE